MTEPQGQSPLTEANPQSLDELFSRDPFLYTQQDRQQIVRELRVARLKWDQQEAEGKARAKAPKGVSAAKVPAQAIDMSLLGLLPAEEPKP